MNMTRAHIFYSGTVQGVGFRYTVQRLARSLDLKGWVKNLPDGRVELLAEGLNETVDQLIRKIEERFCGYIKDQDLSYHQAQGNFRDFEIIF